jgi:hypothetical protein
MAHDPALAEGTAAGVRMVIRVAGDRAEEVTPRAEGVRVAEAAATAAVVKAAAVAIRAVEVDILVAGAVLAEVEAAEVGAARSKPPRHDGGLQGVKIGDEIVELLSG